MFRGTGNCNALSSDPNQVCGSETLIKTGDTPGREAGLGFVPGCYGFSDVDRFDGLAIDQRSSRKAFVGDEIVNFSVGQDLAQAFFAGERLDRGDDQVAGNLVAVGHDDARAEGQGGIVLFEPGEGLGDEFPPVGEDQAALARGEHFGQQGIEDHGFAKSRRGNQHGGVDGSPRTFDRGNRFGLVGTESEGHGRRSASQPRSMATP